MNLEPVPESSHPWLILLLFPFFFAVVWCFVCAIISFVGGWHSLASKYRATAPPKGDRFAMQSCRVGFTNYNNCLTIHVSQEGIHLAVWPMFRLGHPPLFLPWPVCSNPRVRRILWTKMVVFDVENRRRVKLTIPHRIFDAVNPAPGQ